MNLFLKYNKMKVYPKKVKKAYVPMFVNGQLNSDLENVPAKKLNPANFMSKETFAKSKYGQMSEADFNEELRMDAIQCAILLMAISALPPIVVAVSLMFIMGIFAFIGAGITMVIILLGILRVCELYARTDTSCD